MKIIIIGAGLSGLSTAIALRKYLQQDQHLSLEVKVYDKTDYCNDSTPEDREIQRRRRLGAAINLGVNGLKVLHDLDPKLGEKVYAAGYPCNHYKWKTAGGYLLGREYVNALPIARPLLIDCLLEHLPEGIVQYKTISKVVAKEGTKPVLHFEDGSEETADLVVGADGVGSIVRKCIFSDDADHRPQYLGICGVGGVIDMAIPQHLIDDPGLLFIMGSTGVFGYSALTQSDHNKLLYFSMWKTDLSDRGMEIDRVQLTNELRNRHSDWADPLIPKCLAQAEVDHVYPVFVMPQLSSWGKNACVLLGDAAHALPPRTGQGGSQAFEDGQTLALLLSAHLNELESNDAVSRSIQDLYQVRHERVYRLRNAAMKWKDPDMPMSWLKTCVLYAFVAIFTHVRNVMTYFESIDAWDAKIEVEKHLKGEHAVTK